MRTSWKSLIFWLVMAGSALLIWAVAKSSTGEQALTLTFTQFSHEIAQDNVREVTVSGSEAAGIFSVQGVLKKGGALFKTAAPAYDTDWIKALTEKNVSVSFDAQEHSAWLNWLLYSVPTILTVGLWVYFLRIWSKRSRELRSWPPSPPPPEGE